MKVLGNEPVTNFRLRGLITIATDMSQTAAVVAFLTLTTILCHVAYTSDKDGTGVYRNHRKHSRFFRYRCIRHFVDHRQIRHLGHSLLLHSWDSFEQYDQSCRL